MKEGINELYTVMNLFYVGHYQSCINEANKIKTESVEKSAYMYRSYISQKKYRVVLDEIDAKSMPELLPIRLLAEYFYSKDRPDKLKSILETVERQIDEDLDNLSDIWILSAAFIYFAEENYNAVLKLLHQRNDLECLALSVQCLLKLNRVDLARKTTETMAKLDDDATLTQLSVAWVNIAIGGEKLNDAYYIFQEFIDKYTPSVYLLNGQAVCWIGTGKYEEAEELLKDALDKDSNNYDTLVNLATLSQLASKKGSSSAHRYIAQIEELYPKSQFITELNGKKIEFDRLCHLYRPTVEGEA